MHKRTMKTVMLAVLTVVLLAAVLAAAIALDRRNTVDGPTDSGSTQTTASAPSTQTHPTSAPSGANGDWVEGSMGLDDNPFID